MTALLLTLFISAGCFAACSMIMTVRQYGTAALALRDQLRSCGQLSVVRCEVYQPRGEPVGNALIVLEDLRQLQDLARQRLAMGQAQHSLLAA